MKSKGGNEVYSSSAMGSIHELAADLYSAGGMDLQTMREFDSMCLTVVKNLSAEEIRDLREHAHVSQAVMARILNVTTNAVGQWERGEKKPTGSALKLLALARSKGLKAIL